MRSAWKRCCASEGTRLNDERLQWKTEGETLLLHTPIYDVYEQKEAAPNGLQGAYVAIDAPDWVMTVPVYRGCFVMVRQWRHGEGRVTVEFPGGVADAGEDPMETARRELYEETGFRAGKLTHLGSCSPNPALFRNHFHCYLAEELEPTGTQHLDADELLRHELLPIDAVLAEFGSETMTHALMGTALTFYLRDRKGERKC